MQSIPLSLAVIAAALSMATLGACGYGQPRQQTDHQAVAASSGGMGMSQADMTAMCAGMHEKMMGAKTPEERRAIMQEHMKSMSPEMQQRMHENMKSMSPEMRQQMHEHMESMCQ